MSGVHALPIPTPFAVGRVNCYLVDDDPLTLVDTGPNSGTSLTALEAALGEHGRRIEDLERIVITHQHMDHFGLVSILVDRSGAEVCALDRLASWLERFGESTEEDDAFAEAIMLRHGIPGDMVMVLRATGGCTTARAIRRRTRSSTTSARASSSPATTSSATSRRTRCSRARWWAVTASGPRRSSPTSRR